MKRSIVLALTAVAAWSCTASLAGDEQAAPEAPQGGSQDGVAAAPTSFDDAIPDPNSAGPLPLRLLTRIEYQNSVKDLLSVDIDAGQLFPAESSAETGFSKVQKIDQVSVSAYQRAALQIASQSRDRLPVLMGCDVALPADEACVRSFVASFVPKLYRRPLREAELDEHVELYAGELKARLGLAPRDAATLLLATLLQSPYFLYRWEDGSEPAAREEGVVRLNAFHLASQLSYFLWASVPDQALLDAAAAGLLGTAEQTAAQARRMLSDPRAERTIAHFQEQWLGVTQLARLGKSAGLFPNWGPELGSAMAEELRRFGNNVVLHGDGKLGTLLTSRQSFINESLAEVYGIVGVTGAELRPYELPAAQRSGLLTLAGFLTAHSGESEGSPIFRGKFVRERLLCDTMAPPPDGIPPLPEPADDVSIRERHLQHAEVSPCNSCHRLMDPIGFGFGNYDALGRYHGSEANEAVDASGQIVGLDGTDVAFNGPLELAQLLSRSESVRECAAREWFRYAFARREQAPDRASFDQAYAAFRASDYDIRELLVGFTATRSFMFRSIDAGEVFP
jgi:hypothetical protein